MDLALKQEDEAFAASFREWLRGHLRRPPAFVDLADEVDWGRQWQATLAADRWVDVHWPSAYGGRSATPVQVALYQSEYARAQAPSRSTGWASTSWARPCWPTAPRTSGCGTCLRSSPPRRSGASSSASPTPGATWPRSRTRATPVEGGFVVTGRKVWTSYAQFASWGLCLARTDPDAPRPQQGITALIVDMADPGVDVRPLVQMTGDAEFNEVFLTDVFVPAEHVVGIEGQGWTVAGSTLAHERGTNFPFKEQVVHEAYLALLYEEASGNGSLDDPLVADALARPTSISTCCGCTTCARSPGSGAGRSPAPNRAGSSSPGRP